jgi:hypothetical protein
MYHGLTLASDPGKAIRAVANRLRHCFADSIPGEWLSTVGTLGQAPWFGPLEQLRDTALHRIESRPDQLYQVVRRLLLATWYLSDPRAGPDEELLGVLRHDLGSLEQQRPGDGDAFREAQDSWLQAFQDGNWPVRKTWTGRGLLG